MKLNVSVTGRAQARNNCIFKDGEREEKREITAVTVRATRDASLSLETLELRQ